MKKLFIKILPYLVALASGIGLYIFADTSIQEVGLNNLMINVASGLVSIPLVFIFYDTINKLTSQNLHNSVFKSVTFEINNQLSLLIETLANALNAKTPETTEELEAFLELDENEVKASLKNLNTETLETIKLNLTNIIHKQTSLEILSEPQITSILNIIKEITYLIKNAKQTNASKNNKTHLSLNILYILDNLSSWIENGEKDAFKNHTQFNLSKK